jgi:peptidoglycan hydrolase-like protein with peptidoglycan-binding domain
VDRITDLPEVRWRRSLRRSQERRARARRHRRRVVRSRSTTALLLLTMTAGAGGAMAAGGDGETPAPARVALLKHGSRGSVVAELQRRLGVRADGAFGAHTRAAVRRFQRRHRLTPDGVVGPLTSRALGLSLATARTASAGSAAGGNATLQRIAACESGGNPAAVSSSGRYRGKYQFDRQTWRAMGGGGDPAAAPEAEQDRIAARLLAQRGTAPWPNCA